MIFTYRFWKPAFSDGDFRHPAQFAIVILLTAFDDVLQLLFKPGYLNETSIK